MNNPYGLSALWSQGDFIIRSVALLLLIMSIASWYIITTRGWRLFKLRRATRALGQFWHTHSLEEGMVAIDVSGPFNPFRHLALEGQIAVDHHTHNKEDLHGQLTLADWLTDSLGSAIDESAERMQAGLSILASIGSTAPFVGLFGTVWGIYHALVGISVSGQANLSQVAGPVGEALIMTALGLAVAIPAVLAYNTLMRSNKKIINKLQHFARQLHAYFLTGSPVSKTNLKEH